MTWLLTYPALLRVVIFPLKCFPPVIKDYSSTTLAVMFALSSYPALLKLVIFALSSYHCDIIMIMRRIYCFLSSQKL